MSRFIFVSFAFMGWGFYEMSGGADFEPRQEPSAAMQVVKAAFSEPEAPGQAHRASENARALVRNVSFRPVDSAQAQEAPERPAADPELRSRVALRQISQARLALSGTATVFPAVAQQGAEVQLASLEGGLAGIQSDAAVLQPETLEPQPAAAAAALAAEPEAEPQQDIRRIRASRVNMRQGPGTNYPVISRLMGGDEVIVFEDSGTGWLRLRAPEKGKVGWIAASLVSKKRP